MDNTVKAWDLHIYNSVDRSSLINQERKNQMKYHLKNFAVGVLLVVAVLLFIGATNSNNQVGRYEFESGPNSDIFLIDTATGDVYVFRTKGVTIQSGGQWIKVSYEEPFSEKSIHQWKADRKADKKKLSKSTN